MADKGRVSGIGRPTIEQRFKPARGSLEKE